MKTVNIGALKNNLSSYLRDVRNGEELLVKDREKPIARIVPISTATVEDQDAHLIATGQMREASEDMDWDVFRKLPMPEVPEGAAKEALDWVRGKF